MFVAIGLVVLLLMVFGGFAFTGGALGPVMHAIPHEMLIIGGAAAGDAFTEAQAGEQWLVENGVPGQALLPVDEGRDTYESFEAVAAVAEQRGWSSAVLVSDPWHSLRSRTMADDVGLDATTSPTKRGPVVQTRETQLRYIVRETGALIYYHLTHGSSDFSDPGLG